MQKVWHFDAGSVADILKMKEREDSCLPFQDHHQWQSINYFFIRRRAIPSPAKPSPSIASVAGSGTT